MNTYFYDKKLLNEEYLPIIPAFIELFQEFTPTSCVESYIDNTVAFTGTSSLKMKIKTQNLKEYCMIKLFKTYFTFKEDLRFKITLSHSKSTGIGLVFKISDGGMYFNNLSKRSEDFSGFETEIKQLWVNNWCTYEGELKDFYSDSEELIINSIYLVSWHKHSILCIMNSIFAILDYFYRICHSKMLILRILKLKI
jgi:endo-beta-N-acetylglucosaminidase D